MRAVDFPIATLQLLEWPRTRMDHPMRNALVLAFPRDRLRRCHHHLAHRQPMSEDQLVQQRCAFGVHVQEVAEIRHVILVGRQMQYEVDALECG